MQVAVLADVATARERAAGELTAPSLARVKGRPFIDWQLDRFALSGARSVVLCVGNQGEEIETHVRRALDRGLMVGYSYAGAEKVGSGGALRRAYARLESELLLTYGDRYWPDDYQAPLRDLKEHPEALATMCVRYREPGEPGDAVLDGDWVGKFEPATFDPAFTAVDVGVVALRRAALDGIEDGAVWGIEALFRRLARQRKLRSFVTPHRGWSVTKPEDLTELEAQLG